MKIHIYKSFQPKSVLALVLLAAASWMPAPKASAQGLQQPVHQTVPVGEAISCYVNGAAYPVDNLGQIWAIGNEGQWFVTGHIEPGPDGPIAVRNDGTRFPAVCQ